MPRLVLAKCPNCGAHLRLDPRQEIANCGHCGASSFVQTDRRRATAEHPGFVIDVKSRDLRALLLASVLAPVVLGGLATLVWAGAVFWTGHGSRAASPVSPGPEPVSPAAEPSFRWPATWDYQAHRAGNAMDATAPPAPGRARVAEGARTVDGSLPEEVVRRVVRRNLEQVRACYDQGLTRNPALHGTFTLRFVIGRDGAVTNVAGANATLADPDVLECSRRVFASLVFPTPASGIVTVTYQVVFSVAPAG